MQIYEKNYYVDLSSIYFIPSFLILHPEELKLGMFDMSNIAIAPSSPIVLIGEFLFYNPKTAEPLRVQHPDTPVIHETHQLHRSMHLKSAHISAHPRFFRCPCLYFYQN